VKASYERIVRPPPGVVSKRQIDYATIVGDAPDPLTVVFHLQWPDAAMLANFASPWNRIYSAVRLAEDPQFPRTRVLGTGPFVFVEHTKKQYWRAKRWDKYFQPDKPYLDGYQADFMPGAAVMPAYKRGRIADEFRGVTPTRRDELLEALGDRIATSESPWLSNLAVNYSGATDRFLDALFAGQALTTDPRQRAKIVREFERHAMTSAYSVPLLWWDRIVVTSAQLKGWSITPSHFVGQDLSDVWLDK
jgi:peptide/nickel transport system substrate-binding protein